MTDEPNSEYSGYSPLSKQYKADPTIENYVELRRAHPDEIIEVMATGGIDWLFLNEEELKKFSISGDLVASALDARSEAISELSLLLLERLIERDNAGSTGRTHLVSRGEVISDSLVNYLIAIMLDALDWTGDLEIHRDLIVLIRYQLVGENSEHDKNVAVDDKKLNAVYLGIQLLDHGHDPSVRTIAKLMSVNASTVSRWFPDGDLRERIDKMRKMTEEMRTPKDPTTK